jgi:serine protease inhibitor
MTTRKIWNTLVLLAVLLFIASVSGAEEARNDIKSLVRGNTAFAVDLYAKLKEKQGNLFFSPYSISSALAMTYAGARGDTATEMAETLKFSSNEEKTHRGFAQLNKTLEEIEGRGAVELRVANSLWPQEGYPFLPTYLCLLKEYYGVAVTPVDYVKAADQARMAINSWVEEKTGDKIKELIGRGSLTPETVLVLVNAIYFKGKWAVAFDPNDTAKADFSLSSAEKTKVSMMSRKGTFGYHRIEGAQLLELPYQGGDLSMVVILPERADGLSDLEAGLTPEKLDSWLSGIAQREVQVFLPRFKVTWGTFELNTPLVSLGMGRAFGPEADFSGMDGTKTFFIGPVLHKAFIEVNEEGTEAAAATAVTMARSAFQEPLIFRADHPFLFVIRENSTGSILFFGRIQDPGAGGG